MLRLSVNIDHIATIRQARRGDEPDPVAAAVLAELAGADGIIVHLREDRRHIQDRDLRLARQVVRTKLNLEMAATDEMQRIALDVRPDIVTLVPEKREELTTEGGLEVFARVEAVKKFIGPIQDAGIPVSLFVDPDEQQISSAKKAGALWVEIHTGAYANGKNEQERDREYGNDRGVGAACQEPGTTGGCRAWSQLCQRKGDRPDPRGRGIEHRP